VRYIVPCGRQLHWHPIQLLISQVRLSTSLSVVNAATPCLGFGHLPYQPAPQACNLRLSIPLSNELTAPSGTLQQLAGHGLRLPIHVNLALEGKRDAVLLVRKFGAIKRQTSSFL
jgi:hypothetical protein